MNNSLVEKRTKQMDEIMKKCEHPNDKRMTLSAGKKNETCGLCGKVFS